MFLIIEIMTKEELMRRAIELAETNICNNGGPFGAIIADKEGNIISEGSNRVTFDHDPTAHAEINSIRKACATLNTFDLKGYEIYSSCEPCPMCLGAIYWAHLDHIYYANSRIDAQNIGFDDTFIYDEIAKDIPDRDIPATQILRDEAIKTFTEWKNKEDKIEY